MLGLKIGTLLPLIVAPSGQSESINVARKLQLAPLLFSLGSSLARATITYISQIYVTRPILVFGNSIIRIVSSVIIVSVFIRIKLFSCDAIGKIEQTFNRLHLVMIQIQIQIGFM